MNVTDLGYFKFMDEKDQVKEMIRYSHNNMNSFETSIRETLEKIKKELVEDEKKLEVCNDLLSKCPPRDVIPSEEELSLYEEITEIERDKFFRNEDLLAINEMRIIYLFKNLEIGMKSMINTAYSSVNLKSLHKWENMKDYFAEKSIRLSLLTGYQEADQLRKVNNNIKHSMELNSDVKLITEFRGMDFFTHDSISIFCERIKPGLEKFQSELSEAVINERFDFTDEKIETIAKDMYERMEEKDAIKLMDKLKAKYSI